VTNVIGPDEDAFLCAHTRAFLLGTRADGSPTGWPMVGLYQDDTLEFSTYRRSQKVKDFERNPRACCVVAPADGDRALVLRGQCHVITEQSAPTTRVTETPSDVRVPDAIAGRARARMESGKRLVLRFTPTETRFVPGFAVNEDHDE
jgi:hypothetical protein